MDSTNQPTETKWTFLYSPDGKLSVTVHGRNFLITKDQIGYGDAVQAVKDRNFEALVAAADKKAAIADYSDGRIEIHGNNVTYLGRPIHNTLTQRLVQMLEQKLPFEPWLKFLENLMQNPSKRAIQEVYAWVERHGATITEDGCIQGHKKLNRVETDTRLPEDQRKAIDGEPADKHIYIDVHSGTVRQWEGKVVSMPRNEVDDNWGTACSEGFHVGTPDYHFGGDVAVVVHVNPAHFVAADVHSKKFRCSEYTIVKIVDDRDFSTLLATAEGQPIEGQATSPSTADSLTEEDADDQDEQYDENNEDDEETQERIVVTCIPGIGEEEKDILEDVLEGIVGFHADGTTTRSSDATTVTFVAGLWEPGDVTKFRSRASRLNFVRNIEYFE